MPSRYVDNQADDALIGQTITHIDAAPTDPNIRRVRLKRKVVARLSPEQVDELNIAVGDAWTEDLRRRVIRISDRNRAWKKAIWLLSKRAYSSGGLKQKLVRNGFNREVAEAVIEDVVQSGWLDDGQFAESAARSLLARGPLGHRALVARLRQKLLPPDIAEQAARQVLESADLSDDAYQFAAKRIRTMTQLPETTIRRRLYGQLARRGFDGDVIRTAMDRVLDEYTQSSNNDDE
jgi:regulatory protein